jgi:hypothetical protein
MALMEAQRAVRPVKRELGDIMRMLVCPLELDERFESGVIVILYRRGGPRLEWNARQSSEASTIPTERRYVRLNWRG